LLYGRLQCFFFNFISHQFKFVRLCEALHFVHAGCG
jgi:hypothetical protein